MALADATHKAACDAATTLGAYGTVFTDTSGTTGDHEASGVTRQLITWPTGSMVSGLWQKNATAVVIPVTNGVYKEAGVFSAVTAGTFVGAQPFSSGDVSVSGGGGDITCTFIWKA